MCHDSSQNKPQQQSILESLLANSTIKPETRKVNKRKPLHVRRVLRHEQNAAQDEPLDLSYKKTKAEAEREALLQAKQAPTSERMFSCERPPSPTDSVQHLIQTVEKSAKQAASIMASVSGSSSGGNGTCASLLPLLSTPSTSSSLMSRPNSFAHRQQMVTKCLPHRQQKQRQSQRSLIKQKLEDAFKQNGFLVKTKQVSDGDATFCKFRQLRKYTRYYLKSWHHHLPDEVNKLWKGFLPPKTAKLNASPH